MGSRNRCRDGMDEQGGTARKRSGDAFKRADYNNDYLAERCGRAPSPCRVMIAIGACPDGGRTNQTAFVSAPVMQAGLSMVVWILKREVRAIGGCLGIQR